MNVDSGFASRSNVIYDDDYHYLNDLGGVGDDAAVTVGSDGAFVGGGFSGGNSNCFFPEDGPFCTSSSASSCIPSWCNSSGNQHRQSGNDVDDSLLLVDDPSILQDKKKGGIMSKFTSPGLDSNECSLADDIAKLSVQERTELLEDIHGVHTFQEEDPNYIDRCIDEIQKHINRMSNSSRSAYNKANFLAPSKVSKSRKFNLMFLRAACYDTKIAAKRMCKHFEYKLNLFGPEKLTKDITYDDLSGDDIEALHSGYSLRLPGKDSTGRMVWVLNSKQINCKAWDNQLRANWFQLWTAIQDESIQIRGAVMVIYEVDASSAQWSEKFSKERLTSVPVYLEGLPLRTASIHYCFNQPSFKTIIQLYQRVLNDTTRRRFQFHCGGHIECQYELLSFGISSPFFLYDYEGNMKEGLIEMCVEHAKNESDKYFASSSLSSSTSSSAVPQAVDGTNYIAVATDKDVLLGRGVPYQKHAGNVVLSKLIEEKMEAFIAAPKFEKTILTWGIVRKIKEDFGGRFLERVDDGMDASSASSSSSQSVATWASGRWKVCSDEAARYKVAVGFRSNIKMGRRRQRADDNGTSLVPREDEKRQKLRRN